MTSERRKFQMLWICKIRETGDLHRIGRITREDLTLPGGDHILRDGLREVVTIPVAIQEIHHYPRSAAQVGMEVKIIPRTIKVWMGQSPLLLFLIFLTKTLLRTCKVLIAT